MSPQAADSPAPIMPQIRILDAARGQLWSQGWALLPGILTEHVLRTLNDEADRLLAEVPEGIERTSATDGRGGVLVMNGLDSRSELLFDFARTETLAGMAEFLLGKAAIPIHIEYFGKPGAGAAPTPPHQDQIFYEDHFTDEPAMTFWCPLQDVPDGAGALEYASPAAKHGELLAHRRSSTVDFGAELIDAGAFSFASVPVPRGSCLVHHSYAVHRSGPMVDTTQRRVFAFNFRGSSFRQHARAIGSRT